MFITKSVWPELTNVKITKLFEEAVQVSGSIIPNVISFFQWQKLFTPELLSTLPSPTIPSHPDDSQKLQDFWFTNSDVDAIQRVTHRLDQVAASAKKAEVRLLVDAEQTYFQTAIDYFTFQQQEKWNVPNATDDLKMTPAIVYNTYQMYLKNATGRLISDSRRAEVFVYKNALKLVRGAYLFQERRWAEEGSYESPVHETLEDTHRSYNHGIEYMMNGLNRSELLCGTHNENSVKFAAALLSKHYSNANLSTLPIAFGQLLGMCDHMSLILSQSGCQVYKYVPFGPPQLVVPYLIRRAEENSSILGSSAKETRLIWSELFNRLMERFWKR